MNIHQLYAYAQELSSWSVETRRQFHQIPEAGFAEFKTQALICEKLKALNIPYTTERTWIVAEIRGGQSGPTVALRADIDALPVTEPADCPYCSLHEGWMHACGHDAHTAIQLTAAQMLCKLRDQLKGSVRLLFQPAEETVGGAKPMIEAGVMRGVDAVYGLHVQPYLNVGQIDSIPGPLNAATDEIEITVEGFSSHAAYPHLSVDAIVCAAQLITALQTIVSRNTDPLMPAVLSLGILQGGTAKNVICDQVYIAGTLRTATPELRAAHLQRIQEICDGVALANHAKIRFNRTGGYSALVNHPGETQRLFRLGKALLGEENTQLKPHISMGGEDFSYFLEEVPGTFYHLGCSDHQPAPSLHRPDFTVDERCLPIGAALQSALVLDRIGLLDNH
ncbi:MAG: M20 family metallopeptidase [Christensenellales bacterium]|nr:M20 family metallopeptidase [Christensenellales bacterium]